MTYDFKEAFWNANTKWRIELMRRVVNRIIKWYDDNVPLSSNVATWNEHKGGFDIDTSIAQSFQSTNLKRKRSESEEILC